MRLNKATNFAINFAIFSNEFKIPPGILGQMVALAYAAEAAYVRHDFKKQLTHNTALEQLAAEHSCTVEWPGLWPVIAKPHWKMRRSLPSL